MKYDGAPPVYLACASQTPISGVCSSSLSLSLIHSCTATPPHPFPSFLLLSFRFSSLLPSINSFLFACLSAHPFAHPSVRASVFQSPLKSSYPPFPLSIHPSVRCNACPPVHVSTHLSVRPSVRPRGQLPIRTPIHPSLPPSASQSAHQPHSPRRSSPRPTRKRERFLLREDRSDS